MTNAWGYARVIAETLPKNVAWSFNITELEDDATFNIYAPESTWHAIQILLELPRAEYKHSALPGEQSFSEHRLGDLVVTLYTPEVEHEQSDPA